MDEPARLVLDKGTAMIESRSDIEFIDVLRRELPRLQRMARLLTDDADAADDLVAEAIARSLPRWRAGRIDDCAAYVRRVVVNLSAQRWRRRALSRRRDHLALHWIGSIPDAAEAAAERDRTLHAVMGLPVRRRAVVVLRFYDDMPEAEIAAALGISIGTVKSQLSRALEQLRGTLVTLDGA
jgi:RNA polymerase sigma-70 factor (sigma-E family)